MHTLVIGISLALVLLIIPILSDIVVRARDRRDEMKWLIKYGIQVEARIIQVRTMQDWKMSERWYRDSWTGNLKRERTWKMFYLIMAQWVHPQTGRSYTSSTRICSDSMSKPVEGDSGIVWFDPHNPERAYLNLQDRGMELHNSMNEASTFRKENWHERSTSEHAF
jgi:hypothetical protein